MEKEIIDKILDRCKLYSKRNYLGSDGFHQMYGEESITLEKLKKILNNL